MPKQLSKEQLLEQLKKDFPRCWFKDGAEWDGGSAIAWSGESSYVELDIDGKPYEFDAFNYYDDSPMYVFGVLKTLVEWATAHDCHWSCNDPGTFFLYRS